MPYGKRGFIERKTTDEPGAASASTSYAVEKVILADANGTRIHIQGIKRPSWLIFKVVRMQLPSWSSVTN